MRKRARQNSADALEKDEILEDWLSGLPDDILVNIISRLSLKEAARTSVLSSRWEHLWTFTTALNFDDSKAVIPLGNLEEKRVKYINWVNKVLELHRGSSINEFRVCFDLSDAHKSDITNWVCTVIAKRVQNLELDFWPGRYGNYYKFLRECYDNILCDHGRMSSFRCLRSLRFFTVNVSGETLEFLIHNCPLLDWLYVDRSKNLVRLKVVGSSIQLKHLEVLSCLSLQEIEISAPSLLSFKYFGAEIKLRIENVPRLVDLSIRGGYMDEITYFVGSKLCCLPQLKTLELDSYSEVYTQFSECELPNLCLLKLRVTTPNRESLHGLTCIMKACPFLQKLMLQLEDHGRRLGKKKHRFPNYSHQHLKVAELHGFLGRQVDLQVAFYLLQNATMLGKLIVEPSRYIKKKALRHCVKMLEARLPEGVELVVGPVLPARVQII